MKNIKIIQDYKNRITTHTHLHTHAAALRTYTCAYRHTHILHTACSTFAFYHTRACLPGILRSLTAICAGTMFYLAFITLFSSRVVFITLLPTAFLPFLPAAFAITPSSCAAFLYARAAAGYAHGSVRAWRCGAIKPRWTVYRTHAARTSSRALARVYIVYACCCCTLLYHNGANITRAFPLALFALSFACRTFHAVQVLHAPAACAPRWLRGFTCCRRAAPRRFPFSAARHSFCLRFATPIPRYFLCGFVSFLTVHFAVVRRAILISPCAHSPPFTTRVQSATTTCAFLPVRARYARSARFACVLPYLRHAFLYFIHHRQHFARCWFARRACHDAAPRKHSLYACSRRAIPVCAVCTATALHLCGFVRTSRFAGSLRTTALPTPRIPTVDYLVLFALFILTRFAYILPRAHDERARHIYLWTCAAWRHRIAHEHILRLLQQHAVRSRAFCRRRVLLRGRARAYHHLDICSRAARATCFA